MKFAVFIISLALAALASFSGTEGAAAAAAPSAAPGPGDDAGENPALKQWVWCVEDDDEKPICDRMNKVLAEIDTDKDRTHTCIISENGAEGCMKAIRDGEARFGVFDGGEIWSANQQYGLIPIRKQNSDYEPDVYWGVGVVKADKCPEKLQDLKGKVSCHTGYGRSAGWVLPVSYLMQNNIMPVVSQDPTVPNDIESVEHFFSKSCAANDNPKKEICTACKRTVDCNMDDLYYDYDGAFRCLVEGSGDVAFTKHDIPILYAKGGLLAADWNNLGHTSDYKILCPGSGEFCHDTSDYKECNFGEAPGHTIMVSSNFSKAEIGLFDKLMDRAVTNETYTSLFGNETVGNEFAAGVSRSVAYNGTVVELLGPLYNRTLYLQSVNSRTASNDVSHACRLVTDCTSFGLTVFLAVALFLVFTVFI